MRPSGTLRAYWLGAIVCSGGFLLGYDSGVIGGVLTLPSFQRDFDISDHQARTAALVVSLQQLGAFVGCFLVWPVTRRYGRRLAIVAGAAIFCMAALLQTIDFGSINAFYLFRLLAGLGIGFISTVCPIFCSEMAPKEMRGQLGSLLQLMFTFGIFASYWIDYAVHKGISPDTSRQWQVASCQLIPAGLLALGMLPIKESTRWLTVKGRHDEAWSSLCWIRASDDATVGAEMKEIRDGVGYEQLAKANFRIHELVTDKDSLRRVCTAVALFTAQQATGATAFAYYGPQYFALLVDDVEKDLLLTGLFGAVKIIACSLFILFIADRFKRKSILVSTALIMSACQTAAAVMTKLNPIEATPHSETTATATLTPPALFTTLLIYAFVWAYNSGWGPLPWPLATELFPTRTREPGVALAVAAQWLFNFAFTVAAPYAIANLRWASFLLWGACDLGIAVLVLMFLEETGGRSLEDIARTVPRHYAGSADGREEGAAEEERGLMRRDSFGGGSESP